MNRHVIGGLAAAVLATSGLAAAISDASAATAHTTAASPSAATPSATPSAAAGNRDRDLKQARKQAGAVRSAIGLGGQQKLIVKDVVRDPSGAKHVRYERTFRGLPVLGGDLVVHFNASGKQVGVTWNAKKVTVPSITTGIARKKATTKANKAFAAQNATKDDQSSDVVVYAVRGERTLAYDVLTEGVRGDGVPSRLHTIVDGDSGKVLTSYDEIQTGEGHGIYVGTVDIGTQAHTGGGYEIRDEHGNYATDVHNQGDPNTGQGPAGDVFVDADDIWGNGSSSDRASAAVDAQYGAEMTFDYYNDVQGRAGIWGDGRGARSRVHFANAMQNAFWDGEQMSYGDGAGNAAPLVELDVAGHEMSHGVTENTAGLVYSGDAGGLNEATSDIFGTAVEWHTNNSNDVADYLIGEELDLRGNGTPLRYMDKPSKDGQSRDCWSSTLGNLDPHYSSGPLNHWFYLASEGSGAKTINGVSYNSPTCNNSTVTGVGRDAAEKIWYRTLSVYLTSNSRYADARNGAIKSAKDLYPNDPSICEGIANAFSAIAVAAGTEACSATPPAGSPTVSSPGNQTATQGTAITQLTLRATGGTAPYTWTVTGLPAGLSATSAGVISGTPTTAGSSSVTAKVTDAAGKTGTASFTWTVNPSGGGGSTCTGALAYSGTLSAGQSKNLASFTDSDAGQLKACLDGPTGTDFDLYLQRSYSGYWITVASSTGSGPDESLSYDNSAGTYRLVVKAYAGSGAFTAGVSE
ncbi:M4 family metallopeptidase [Nocardioides sp. QY071]|uniref:M4 family metallopeptidase n=1 Tax=Nocardioides sp. QY071 TaxID=3044187 RepID=UPI00249A112F|nr:M4 family metallopeptidase [Nocardioides sp. QY071]WGY02390.1 M4 family metallopeptidase [Nocardioides sp. QY071]